MKRLVVSPTMAHKLKLAGFKRDTLFCWVPGNSELVFLTQPMTIPYEPAPTLQELLSSIEFSEKSDSPTDLSIFEMFREFNTLTADSFCEIVLYGIFLDKLRWRTEPVIDQASEVPAGDK